MDQSTKDLLAEIERLKAINADLSKPGKLGLAVGVKGGVAVSGLGKFPVTLYKEQWARLIEFAPQITAFIKANESKLKAKGDTSWGASA